MDRAALLAREDILCVLPQYYQRLSFSFEWVDGCLKYFAKCKRTVVMAHHLDFLVFNSFMGKFCPIHIHPLNLKGTLELTFVFPGNFLILSPVSVVFALHYCSVCSSEAKFLVLHVQDAILKPSNLLLNKTEFILTFQSSNSTFSLEVDIKLIVCYKVTQNMEIWFQQEKSCSSIWPIHANRLVRLRGDVICRDGRSQMVTVLLCSHTQVVSVCCQSGNCSEARREVYTEAEGFWHVEEKPVFKNEIKCLVGAWKLCLFGPWFSVKSTVL